VTAVESVWVKRCILDGEVVALDEQGRHSFGLLQNFGTSKAPLRLYVLDLLHLDNENLRQKTLERASRAIGTRTPQSSKNYRIVANFTGLGGRRSR
jgi:ATP-dependent DNA ligase